MTTAVAVIADAHLHHPLAWPLPFPAYAPWQDVRTAARAVNESVPAFLAALAMVRARGIRHVVLLGDYSDDGQHANLAATAGLLAAHSDLTFSAIPGNHDGWGLAGKHTATRYGTALVTSDPSLDAPGTIVTDAARVPGLQHALQIVEGAFAYPRMEGVPELPATFAAVSADGSVAADFPERSFVAQPASGLWLLHLDANIFEPAGGGLTPHRKRALLDPATAGWDACLRQKPYILGWIKSVSSKAAAVGATLVGLSHYPAVDPYGDVAQRRAILGASRETRVIPPDTVAPRLAGAGLQLLVTGHLHCAGIRTVDTVHGPFTQVALPSPTAFPPGFALIHPGPRVEWVSLAEAVIPQGPGYPTDAPRRLGPFLAAQARARFLHRLARHWPALPPGVDLAALADVELLRKAGPFAGAYLSAERLRALRGMTSDHPVIAQHLGGTARALERFARGATIPPALR